MLRKVCLGLLVMLLVPGSVSFGQEIGSDHPPVIRQPAVAGRFYSGNPDQLKQAIKGFLKEAIPPGENPPIALIAPHAGYIYSGQICADAYNQAAGHSYDLIVLLGTNHTVQGFHGVSIYPGGGYRTPLGIMKIDGRAAKALMEKDAAYTFEESVHLKEHSVEVQVPFVQMLFPEAKILTAVMGSQDLELSERFGTALAEVVRNRRALIIASSDLSHYPSYKDAVEADQKTLQAVLSMNPSTLEQTVTRQVKGNIPNLSTCACGRAPMMAAMTAAKVLGANCARLVSYANSGDVPIGDRSRVVGYAAVSFTKDRKCSQDTFSKAPGSQATDGTFGIEQKKELLSLARKTIEQVFTSATVPLTRGADPLLKQQQGAFVTLKNNGSLRGCIGHMAQDTPLHQVVSAMALKAAFSDKRFRQVRYEELPEIEIEISVLTPYQRVTSAEAIRIGRDGVILQKGNHQAVFLPQVAVEQGWDRETMLDRLCRKAGLEAGSWKSGVQLYTFQAIVFSEAEFH